MPFRVALVAGQWLDRSVAARGGLSLKQVALDSRETGGMWRAWYRGHETVVRPVAYDGWRGTGVRQVWDRCQTDGVRQE